MVDGILEFSVISCNQSEELAQRAQALVIAQVKPAADLSFPSIRVA